METFYPKEKGLGPFGLGIRNSRANRKQTNHEPSQESQ